MFDGIIHVPRIIEAKGLRGHDPSYGMMLFHGEAGSVRNTTHFNMGDSSLSVTVGVDVFYGEDFFSYPVFDLRGVNWENEIWQDTGINFSHHFGADVDFVQILAVDIVNSNAMDGIRMIASVFSGDYGFSLRFYHFPNSNIGGNPVEQTINPALIGDRDMSIWDAWFDADGNILLQTFERLTQTSELIVLDQNFTRQLARFGVDVGFTLTLGVDGRMWGIEPVSLTNESSTLLRALDSSTWTWVDDVHLPISNVLGLNVSPTGKRV